MQIYTRTHRRADQMQDGKRKRRCVNSSALLTELTDNKMELCSAENWRPLSKKKTKIVR